MKSVWSVLLVTSVWTIRISELPGWVQIPPLVEKVESRNYILLNDEALSLPCKSTGNPKPKIVWFKDGTEVVENSDFEIGTDGSLQVTTQDFETVFQSRTAPAKFGGQYTCNATNIHGVDTGVAITIRLPLRRTSFSRQKTKERNVRIGQTLTINCEAPVPTGSEIVRVWNYQNFTTIPVKAMKRVTELQNGEVLFFSNIISKDDNLKIMCQAHEKVSGSTYPGNKYVINVRNITRVAKAKVPEIFENNPKQEVDISATIGQTMILECAASGVPTPDIAWRFINQYGTEMPFPLVTTFGARNATMEIRVLKNAGIGRYRCQAKNTHGIDKKDFVLKQQSPPMFTTRPKENIVAPARNKEVELSCGATGSPMPKTIWYRNGVQIEMVDKEDIAKITVKATSSEDTASYQCIARNKLGEVSSSAQFLVLEKAPRLATDEQLNTTSRRRYVVEGKSISLKCDLFGFPEPNYTWTVGRETPDQSDLSSSDPFNKCSGLKTCIVSNVRASKTYNCEAENSFGSGSMSFSVNKLTKTQIQIDPIIRTTKGETAILSPVVNHDNYIKDYNITWFKKGKNGSRKKVLISQSYLKGIEYKIPKTSFVHRGDYIVKVQTQFDVDEKTVNLVIEDFPEPPMSIQVENIQKSVKVSFEPGFNNYADIEEYDIEFAVISLTNANEQGKWQKMKTVEHKAEQLSKQVVIVTQNLVPYTKYSVRVRARNKIGLSLESREDDQSNSVITTLPARPDRNPDIVQIVGHKPAEILVKWTAIPEMYYNGPDFQYVLEYCLNEDPNQLCGQCPKENWRKEILAAPTTEYVIKSSTIPYKRFSIKLGSKNNINYAPPPKCKIAFSGEAQPKSAPMNLAESAVASPVGKNFISLSWDALPKEQLNGKLKEYVVKYKVGEGIGSDRATWDQLLGGEKQLSVKNEGIILQKLKPARTYYIRVAVVNGAGEGPFSTPLLVTTKEDIPGPPIDLKVTEIWPDRLNIAWRQPKEPNGIITGYIYKINGVPRNQPAGKYVVTEASGESSGINKSRLDIAKLQPEYNYSIELYAKTSAGQGMEPAKINASTISFDAARPLVPVQVNVTQLLGVVNISWSYDEKSQFLPDNYTLLYRMKDPQNLYAWTTEIIPEMKSPYKVLDKLKSGANITMKLFSSNKYGRSDNYTEDFTTEEGPIITANLWFVAVLIGVGVTLLLIIIVCFVQHNKTGKYPVQTKQDMIVDDNEGNVEDRKLIPPQSPRKSSTGRYRSFNSDIVNHQLSRSDSRSYGKSQHIEMRQSPLHTTVASTVGSDASILMDNDQNDQLSKTESALELALVGPSPEKLSSPHVYGPSEMRKASSESDSIAGFGADGNVTRHYTENGSFIGQYAQDNSQRESSVRSGHSPEDEPVADLKTFGPTN